MSDFIIITDDSDDRIEFATEEAGGNGYELVPGGWSPAVAQRDEANGETWEHVDEEMRLIVSGETAGEAGRRLQLLAEMVDRAGQVWRGQREAAVTIRFQISDSETGGAQRALLTGRPASGEVLQLPSDYDSATSREVIGSASDPVIWRWRRRGALLQNTFTATNHVTNSSFELFSSGDFTDWIRVGAPTISRNSDTFRFGFFSARIENAGAEAGRGIVQDVTGLNNGEPYFCSAWVFVQTGTMRLEATDGGTQNNPVIAASSGVGWQRLEVTKTATAGGIRIGVQAFSAGAIGFFDGAMLSESSSTIYHPAAAEAFEATSAAAACPNTLTADFAVSGLVSYDDPVVLSISGFLSNVTPKLPAGLVVISSTPDHVAIAEAEGGSVTVPGAGTFATAADATNLARGGSIRTLVPNSGGDYTLSVNVTLDSAARHFAVIAAVRNNGALSYRATATIFGTGTSQQTATVVIDDSSADPRLILIGAVPLPSAIASVTVTFTPSGTGNSSQALDVDYLVIAAIDAHNRIIAIGGEATAIATAKTLVIDHRTLERATPIIYAAVTSSGDLDGYLAWWRGQAYVTMTGLEVCVTPLFTRDNYWRYATSGGAETNMTLVASRTLAHLVGQ